MTCINCRNPLSENSTICEWCGNEINNNTIPTSNDFIVEKILSIAGRGSVLDGKFSIPNKISKGDLITYKYNNETKTVTVCGIYTNAKLEINYFGNDKIGILI